MKGAKNILYEQKYQCPECGKVQKHLVWSKEFEEKKHECSDTNCRCELTFEDAIGDTAESSGMTILNGKMTKDEIRADRTKRRKDHFQKEVMPYLPKEDQRAFSRKGYRNK